MRFKNSNDKSREGSSSGGSRSSSAPKSRLNQNLKYSRRNTLAPGKFSFIKEASLKRASTKAYITPRSKFSNIKRKPTTKKITQSSFNFGKFLLVV